MNIKISILIGKLVYKISQLLHLGAGGTWPGEVAHKLDPQILTSLLKQIFKGIIIVAGTNGKTTTSLMIQQILKKNNLTVIHNATGANLINGIVSSLLINSNWTGQIKADWGIFEVDENSLPLFLKQLRTANCELRTIIVLLNIFRDQLDRYGEVDVIVEKWQKALVGLISKDHRIKSDDDKQNNITLILNADDPAIAHIGKSTNFPKKYFGINKPEKYLQNKEHATDSIFCLNCGNRLNYQGIYLSHLGIWECKKCGEKRPNPNISDWKEVLPGLYNTYNTLAAISVAKEIGMKDDVINKGLDNFQPAFGRQEEFNIDGKKVKIFLAKNPVGFNASLKTVLELIKKDSSRFHRDGNDPSISSMPKGRQAGQAKKRNNGILLLVLNDRIPDGKDISWIWDVDFEMLIQDEHVINVHDEQKIIVSGDRTYDLALRIKYCFQQFNNVTMKQLIVKEDLKQAIKLSLANLAKGDTLYILPTYSAMLEVRKILGGRKIM